MSRTHLLWLAIPFISGLILAGCNKSASTGGHEGHDHSAHTHAEDESPVKFKEGSGLQLSAETSSALGLRTGEAEERSLRHVHELTASVFDAGPPARASSLVPREIADELGISEHTVKFHIAAIFAKLGVTTRAEAVGAAYRLGLARESPSASLP